MVRPGGGLHRVLGWVLLTATAANLFPSSGTGLAQEAPLVPTAVSIQDERGRGIEDVVVQVLRMPPAGAIRPYAVVLTRTRTAGDGTTEGSLPSVRGMTVVVDHPRYERFVGAYHDGRPPATIRLGPGRVLEGQVLSADGSEAAGATVCVRWEDDTTPSPANVVRRCADASEDGRFVVSGLSAFAEAEVVAEAEGHGRAAAELAGDPWPERPLVLRLDDAAAEDEASTLAARSGSVRVQVLSTAGIPIDRFAMRVVILRPRSHAFARWEAEQDTSPVIVPIPGDTARGDLQVHFLAENHVLSDGFRLYPNPGSVTDLGVVYLEPGAVVTGRLFDSVGSQPVAGCILELLPAGSGRFLHRLRGLQHVTVSDGEGAFLLGGLTEGRYYLRTECRTGPPTERLIALDDSERADLGEIWMPAARAVRVRVHGAGSGTIHVMDRFREAGTSLATAVLQPATAPESAREDRGASSFAEVQLAPGRYRIDLRDSSDAPGASSVHRAQVAADGSFMLEGAPDEFLWMTWFAPDGRSRVGRIWPDRPLSELDLGGTSVVSGELRPAAGRVLTKTSVVLIGDLGLDVAGTFTAENGYFALPPVPPGRYRLQANTGAALATADLVLNADEPPPFQILQADEDGVGEVEVRLATPGIPLVGARLHVLGADGTLAASRLVVENGVFLAGNVPAGEVTVLWDHGGACVGADKVTLEAGRSARLERTLRLGRLLELRCSERSCAGETLSLVRLTTEAGVKVAHHLTAALPGTTFSDDGRVGLGCLTPGAYSLSLWADGRRWDAEFELEPGPEEIPVTVTVRPSAG